MYFREVLVLFFLLISLILGICSIHFQVNGLPSYLEKSTLEKSTQAKAKPAVYQATEGTDSTSSDTKNKVNTSPYLQGVDVSHWDGTISWNMVKRNNISFAFIKATEGEQFVDPKFHYNWSETQANGILRGAYHFYQPNDDPIKQANHFMHTISYRVGDLPPVLDIEISRKVDSYQLGKDILQWLEAVEQGLGVKPIIYTDGGFWNDHIVGDFGSYPLWIADWNVTSPVMPQGWTTWLFWQYSVKGKIKGINYQSVDLNYFSGTTNDLKQISLSNFSFD